MAGDPTRWVALLRGINLGRARQVDMPRLREVLTGAGHRGVRTLLRSGNVVLDSPLPEEELATELSRLVAQEFGFAVPVVVRSGTEIAALVREDPLGDVATDPARYAVTFMSRPPDPDRVAALPPADSGRYVLRGRELVLWLPDGFAGTPLAGWDWDALLGVPGTTRNWNTVSKLAALADGPAPSE
jgi:uncharacterized protein (DUF1697 family)